MILHITHTKNYTSNNISYFFYNYIIGYLYICFFVNLTYIVISYNQK